MQLVDEAEDGVTGVAVEVPGGLVGQHDGRLADQCPGDRDPLPLSPGQLGRLSLAPVTEPHPLQCPGGSPVAAGSSGLTSTVIVGVCEPDEEPELGGVIATVPTDVTRPCVVELSGRVATLTVVNGGPVIPPEEVGRLLQPFQRLNGSREHDRDGLGLGLSIVQAIATAHGGSLLVTARPGGGLDIAVRVTAAEDGSSSLRHDRHDLQV